MKRLVIIVLCCCALLLSAAGPAFAKGQSSAKKAVKEYYDAWYALDAQKAYDSLAQVDKDEMSFAEFTSQYNFNAFEEKLVRAKSSYKIVSIKDKGDKPTAEIMLVVPDNNALAERFFSIGASFKSANMTDQQIEEAVLKQIKKEKIPTLETTITIKLIKDAEGWHVFNDWATEKQVKELLGKAWSASFNGDAITALAAYEEALKLDPASKDAQDGRAKVVDEAKKMEADLAFAREYIEIADLEAANKDIYGKLQPVVTFTVKNNSDKTLSTLKLRVSYLDADGQVLNESMYDALGGFFSSTVKPGEVYTPNTTFYPSNAQEWQEKWVEGRIKLEIANVSFRD